MYTYVYIYIYMYTYICIQKSKKVQARRERSCIPSGRREIRFANLRKKRSEIWEFPKTGDPRVPLKGSLKGSIRVL